jgi:5-methylcytosine-specific restriction endonuclease McrA
MEHRFFDEQNYKAWRLKVYQRDRFTCRYCGASGRQAKLNAHHIQRWVDHPSLRYEVTNGITLCYKCHKLCKDNEEIYAPIFLDLLRRSANI